MEIIKDRNIHTYYLNKFNFQDILTLENNYEIQLCEFNIGEHVCRAGDESNYIYFFLEGQAKTYTTTESGKSLLFSFYDDFEFVGDVELMTSQAMVANVECITKVCCFRIPTVPYRQLLLQDNKLLKTIATKLALKLNNISSSSARNLLYPLENRLAAYIISMNKEFYFNENLVQTAELLGASYRHLLRCLKKFCENNYMEKLENGYYINDYDKLVELGESVYK
ncbi:cyclic nucleotide-binding domain-containing protein [Anaerosporobacter sp.]|uniref:cyclic nucleotide-binding domain-containing protein n=1 Tax=Anaerosporobacter sp. TaxID=1872529 RepID=UPI00286EE143|nr:cyclic nucleotide-binding domain-containing protein [Anaerosporobacter sp.]